MFGTQAKEEWFGMVVCSEDRVSVGSAGDKREGSSPKET